jgi:FixJ family two-component response regulator
MPGINGKELADKLLELKPELKVAFMSGYTFDILGEKTIHSGAIFFNKPLSTLHLAKSIRNLLDGNSA